MWDEKKFFEDFVRESEEMKPDPEFVNRMLELAEEKQKKPVWKLTGYRMVAAVAAVALICVAGSRFMPGLRKDTSVRMELELQAGKENTPVEEIQEEKSSAEGEQEGAEGAGMSGSIGELMNGELTRLQDLLAEEDCVVTDYQGNELSEEEKVYLTERISTAKECPNAEVKWGDSALYQIQGSETMVIYYAGYEYLEIAGDENTLYIME